MSWLEVNKIIASIIITMIVIGIISIFGDLIFTKSNNEAVENAYHIDINVLQNGNEASNSQDVESSESISLLFASESLEKGEKIFKKCSACHTYRKNGANKVGPNLWNIVNKTKASVPGFAYSKELSEYGGIWGFNELSSFLHKPKEYIKGTKMNFSGLKKAEDRANLILFLLEQAEEPAALP